MSDSAPDADLTRELAASRRRESWLSAPADVITLMLLAEDPHDVLTLLAERAREAAGADHCSLVLHQEDGTWRVTVATGLAADEIRGSLVPADAPSADVAVTGRTFRLGEDGDPAPLRLASQYRPFGARVYAALAQRDDRPIGTLVLANAPGGRPFDDEDARLATGFANQAGLALALTEARAAEDRLAVYAERERIARDLHDLTIQRIFAAGLALQALRRRVTTPAPDLDAAAARLDSVIDELDAAIAEIRTTIFDLQLSPEQEVKSIRAQILREASRSARMLGFDPAVSFIGPLDAVGEDVGAHLVAAVRETLANAAKHAGASRVEVTVAVCEDAPERALTLDVRDDGPAPMALWLPDSVSTTSSAYGLANLAARAKQLGGEFGAGPGEDGKGTRVTWRVPL